jgi:YVTN family beta-propeller protein
VKRARILVVAVMVVAAGCAGTEAADSVTPEGSGVSGGAASGGGSGGGASTTEPSTTTTSTTPPRPPAETLVMQRFRQVGGDISPKSVVASGTGLVTAQNMMYTHTVTAYDADGNLVATVPDTVTLSEFGIDKPGEYRGAPVEAAFTPDGRHVYVSNYAMYGPGFSEGSDSCTPASNVPASYLYRIDTSTWTIDQVVPAGSTPKFVAVTPDAELVLATNWCSWDLTIAGVDDGAVRATLPIGRYPRGIAVSPDSTTAWIAVMGTSDIAEVELATGAIRWIRGVGRGPRQVVLSPDGTVLYATLNSEGKVAKVDLSTGQVVAKVATGSQPRSMAISGDGTALYVVNYGSDDVSKLATTDLREIQRVPSGHHPIGIAYDDSTGRVWVANYSGTIDVYDEAPA